MAGVTATLTPFTFDGRYSNLAQVTPYYPAFTARMAELEATDRYPYNSSFKGHLGIADSDAEDTAIYLCQTRTHVHEDALKVNAFVAEGGRPLAPGHRFGGRVDVAMFGFYMGGSGFRVHKDVRLVYRAGDANTPYMVLPKGKRTHGYALEGAILARPV